MCVLLANETSDKASEIDDNFQALTTETLRIEAPTVFTCIPMSNIVKQRQMEDKTKITQDYGKTLIYENVINKIFIKYLFNSFKHL